jgi:hypothetical protein
MIFPSNRGLADEAPDGDMGGGGDTPLFLYHSTRSGCGPAGFPSGNGYSLAQRLWVVGPW